MSVISMKNLLEAGVHFGHQTRKWNPKMAPYVFTARNGIHIIDLQKTVQKTKEAYDALKKLTSQGKKVLFVGTKKQARGAVEDEAQRCNMFYISNRWLGGLLTNWNTVKKSIARLKKLEQMVESNSLDTMVKTKREQLGLQRELEKLRKTLGGIKDMNTIPEILFVIDPKKEEIAVKEAKKLGLTVFAVIDTNCDPELIDHAIPGNDDAIRAIRLFLETMANAVIEGTGGEVEKPKFSDDFDVDEDEMTKINYQGEYDEEGNFIKDDDDSYEKEFAKAREIEGVEVTKESDEKLTDSDEKLVITKTEEEPTPIQDSTVLKPIEEDEQQEEANATAQETPVDTQEEEPKKEDTTPGGA